MPAPAYVRNTSVQNAGNGGDVAFTISPSASVGDLLVVAYDSSAQQLSLPSDFTHLGTFSGTGTNDVWYKYLQAGDAGRTVDFGTSVSLFQFILIECSGAAGPPTLTTHAVTNGGASGNVTVSGPTTSAADPWLPIVLWASFDGTGSLNASITSLSGVTLIANLSPGAGYPNALAAGYQAGQAAGATNPASSAACDTGSTQTSVAALIAVHSATAPSAATLATPPNASYLDATVGATFQANFNSTSGANANAYALRIKSGGAYSYWNAGTSSWQSTIVWNACSVAPGAQLAVGPITAGLANGTTYNWSMAFQEATASLQGPFASDFTFSAQAAPTLVVNAPTGTVTTTNEPVVSWTTTPGGTAVQTSYRVVVYPSSVYTAAGFAAGQASGAVWDSGVVASSVQSVAMGAALPTNNTTYRAYVQVTETGGETSAWQFSGFTLSLDAPAAPGITATAGTDPATGAPRIALAVQGRDNFLSTDDASVEGSVGTHAARTNCSVAQSTAQAQDGTHSLALTSTAAGAMSESTATGTSGYPVTPGATYSWMSSYRSGQQTYDQQIVALSPLAYWKLADAVGATTAADSSGNSKTGTVVSGVTFGQAGPVAYEADTAAAFSSGSITTPSIDGNLTAHGITWAVWFKGAHGSGQSGFYGQGGSTVLGLDGSGGFKCWLNGTAASIGSVPSDSNWHQLAVVFANNSSSRTLYLDGAAIGTDTSGTPVNFTGTGAIGSMFGNVAGSIGQVSIFNTGLTATQVGTLYASGAATSFGQNCRTDLAWYNAAGTLLSTSQGAQVTDTTTGWTPSVGSAGAPAGAATAAVVGNVLSTGGAGEVHYEDQWGIFPGTLGYEMVVASDTPVGYWKLGSPSGTTEADSSGNGNNGTIHGTVTGGQAGPIATYPAALADLFDGSTGYIDLGAPSALNVSGSLTLEAWIKTTAGGTQVIVQKSSQYELAVIGGTLNVAIAATGGGFTFWDSGTVVNDATWHHVVVTYDGTTVRTYKDGVAGNTTTRWSGAITIGSGEAGIGNAGSAFFNGSIDEVAVYSTVLSAARVTAHYNAATVAGSYVQGWSRGGLVGSTTAAILRSDGLYVRGAGWAPGTSKAVPAPGEAVTVYDYEVAVGTAYTYQAVVSAVLGGATISSPLSAASGAATATSTNSKWWIFDPTNTAGAVGFDTNGDIAWKWPLKSSMYFPLGKARGVKFSDGVKGKGGTLPLLGTTPAQISALETLLASDAVYCLVSPGGETRYINTDGDITETSKGEVVAAQTVFAQPFRFNTFSVGFYEADRP